MRKRTTNDRGQVGIGTLIVFIAMVLVAAIAAGVLINTAGFLQSSAEQTGQESSQQVTNRLQTSIVTGNVTSTPSIDEVNITVNRAPGASSIDLDNVTLSWTGPDGAYTMTSDEFDVGTIKGVGSNNVLDDAEDRAIISIDLGGTGPAELNEGESATVHLTTASGGTTTVYISVPQSLSGESAVEL